MFQKQILCSMLILAAFTTYAQDKNVKSDNPLQSAQDKKVDEAAQVFINNPASVGISIGIIRGGKQYTYNYGETKRGLGNLPDSNTVYELGSISKTFTSTLLALEIVKKKMKAGDPISLYLPDNVPPFGIRYNDTPVTLLTLANHTSGLPRLPSNIFATADRANPYAHYDFGLMLGFLKNYKLTRAPGSLYEYSNYAVGLLGSLIAIRHKSTYEQLIISSICQPLGMTSTAVKLTPGMQARFAQAYDGEGNAVSQWDFDAIAGAGGIRSTVTDMLRYLQAELGGAKGDLGKAMVLTRAETYAKDNMYVTMGWHITKTPQYQFLAHNGQTGGYHTYAAFDPAKQVAVVVLTNIGADNAVGQQIMQSFYTE